RRRIDPVDVSSSPNASTLTYFGVSQTPPSAIAAAERLSPSAPRTRALRKCATASLAATMGVALDSYLGRTALGCLEHLLYDMTGRNARDMMQQALPSPKPLSERSLFMRLKPIRWATCLLLSLSLFAGYAAAGKDPVVVEVTASFAGAS